jgi:hypothetical protein
MRKIVRWDDDEAISHDAVRMRDLILIVISGGGSLHACNNRIFVKFVMDITPFEVKRQFHILIYHTW